MLMRKAPGFVPASPWGLRLPQKFLFLLFLSGLVTLCFGALFLLPHSSRLKRLFLAPRTQQPGLEMVAEIAGHPPVREREPPPNPAPAAPAPGKDDHNSRVKPHRRKGWLRHTRPTGSREEATAALRPGDDNVLFSFDFNAFRSRLRHPVLGTRANESEEPQGRVRAQREKIKEMMQFAWQSYKRYAMGENELRPLTKDGYEGNMFGGLSGATVIDSLDTLYLMELKEEFQEAKAWVEKSFHLNVSGEASLFEVNIRYIGGLLSAFYLTGEEVFRIKAIKLGEKLLPAFKTPTGIPKGVVSFKSGRWGWATAGSSSILAEFGSLHLEFLHLTELSGNQVFAEKATVRNIRKVLRKIDKPFGLYPNFLSPVSGNWVQHHVSVGGLGDSFYEYLIKSWLMSAKTDMEAKNMYYEALEALLPTFDLPGKDPGAALTLGPQRSPTVVHQGWPCSCTSSFLHPLGIRDPGHHRPSHQKEQPSGLTQAFRLALPPDTKLGPEAFWFNSGREAVATQLSESYYILRPEVVESYMYLWRQTHDPIYRKWGWEVVMALEKYCRTEAGFSGIQDVYSSSPNHDNKQQSFFLAETLKYLYLLFSEDDVLSLEDWVFNTEAHPLPVNHSDSSGRTQGRQ
uniref:alpha-1,2-Mannosidase n=1 Tax=Otolemur garnettii TaxID=30611 RepID=H0WK16_OTOGA